MKAVSWKEDGMTKFWSEAHVSEDFDMSLRLQTKGCVCSLGREQAAPAARGVAFVRR